ncbi:MAG: methyltransferase domain-containing protein [Bacillota bacterium]|nr:methyltransferase domain-containing protein [Bacillota bacterium]
MYNEFADLYDELMEDIKYDKWADYYQVLFKRAQISPALVLDLGCGTGTLTSIMSGRGYDMIGVDSSVSMLNKAAFKSTGILFLNQDMTEFELYGTVDAIISSLDCINYIIDENELLKVFKLALNYLDNDGLFVFDINSSYKLKHILGDNIYTYDENGIFYTWESFYDNQTNLCDFNLTFFIEEKNGHYTRLDESQTERAWSVDEIQDLLIKAGFKEIEVFGDKTLMKPSDKEERIFFTARKLR